MKSVAVAFRRIFRYEPAARKLRLFALTATRFTAADRRHWHWSAKLSLSLRPLIFRFQREWRSWRLVLLGVDLHWQTSMGGRFP